MKSILVLNAGSSSLKYALFKIMCNRVSETTASGIIEQIGQSGQQTVKHQTNNSEKSSTVFIDIPSHEDALKHALCLLDDHKRTIAAVGHRVVHGGRRFTKPQIVDGNMLAEIKRVTQLAPLHNPPNIVGLETAISVFPASTKQVAVFDTAFHSTLPKSAYMYGLPYRLYEEHGVRKYGFHGTSHEYVMNQVATYLNKNTDELNLITCHLGAGSSMSCIRQGVCVDTTMGLTPLEGLLMATRSGDVDCGVIFFLMKQLGIDVVSIEKMFQEEGGWFGVSGVKDARELEAAYRSGSPKAVLAVEMIVHRIRKYIGMFYWQLSGKVDAIAFTAGLGENWAQLRDLCLEGGATFGFEIDSEKNSNALKIADTVDISVNASAKKIFVVRANEELSIAQQSLLLFNTTEYWKEAL